MAGSDPALAHFAREEYHQTCPPSRCLLPWRWYYVVAVLNTKVGTRASKQAGRDGTESYVICVCGDDGVYARQGNACDWARQALQKE